MSFSSDTKKEITNHLPKKACCVKALSLAEEMFRGEEDPESERLRDIMGRSCCRRAFLKGAFLEAGSISDPGKSYRLEIICKKEGLFDAVKEAFSSYEIEGKRIERKGAEVFYIKNAQAVSDALGVLEAPEALMRMDNVVILRDVRNGVNRQSNCDSGNIAKTVAAAARQIKDIQTIEGKTGLAALPKALRQTARARLAHPDVPLSELGNYLRPPVSKSCVCHRMRKISAIAKEL